MNEIIEDFGIALIQLLFSVSMAGIIVEVLA